jgi:hypothetical protein
MECVHPPGFTLQNNIDYFIACGASVAGVFMDDGELMLQKSYGKLGTSVAGDLMKHGDPRLQEVLRKNGNDYYRRSYERWDLMLQVVLRKWEAYILGDMIERWEFVLQDVLWKTAYFCYRVSYRIIGSSFNLYSAEDKLSSYRSSRSEIFNAH